MMHFKTLIIADGEIPNHQDWSSIQYEQLICTDGAAVALKQMGVMPDIIIGDLDSLLLSYKTSSNIQKAFPPSKIVQQTEQDTTDFEKGLLYATQHLSPPFLCLGIFGNAIDHTLYNLCLFAKYCGISLSAIDAHGNEPHGTAIPTPEPSYPMFFLNMDETATQWGFMLPPKCRIYTEANRLISFFPMPTASITSEGLHWELKQSQLSQQGAISVRNRSAAPVIRLETLGQCFVILTQSTCPKIEVI